MARWNATKQKKTFGQVYSKVSGETAIESPTIDVSSKEFYGEGYDDSDKRIPDMTIINRQLGNLLVLCLFNHNQTKLLIWYFFGVDND